MLSPRHPYQGHSSHAALVAATPVEFMPKDLHGASSSSLSSSSASGSAIGLTPSQRRLLQQKQQQEEKEPTPKPHLPKLRKNSIAPSIFSATSTKSKYPWNDTESVGGYIDLIPINTPRISQATLMFQNYVSKGKQRKVDDEDYDIYDQLNDENGELDYYGSGEGGAGGALTRSGTRNTAVSGGRPSGSAASRKGGVRNDDDEIQYL
ncbi:hypothetical protein BGZ54_007712 [Gamsiella multidivaricata]|nr:hypothetical protein BGZ54_007712 [Gamsiella multidivaricata]